MFTETVFCFFLGFAIYLLDAQIPRKSFLLGIVIGFSASSRYQGLILIAIPIVLGLLKKTRLQYQAFTFGLLIGLTPLFLVSQINYDHPLGSLIMNYSIVSGDESFPISHYAQHITSFFGVWSILILAAPFLGKGRDVLRSNESIIILFLFGTISLVAHKELRYLVPLLPPFAVILVKSLRNVNFILAVGIVQLFIALQFSHSYSSVFQETSHVFMQFSYDIENDTILSNRMPYANYLSNAFVLRPLPSIKGEKALEWYALNHVEYAFVGGANPPFPVPGFDSSFLKGSF